MHSLLRSSSHLHAHLQTSSVHIHSHAGSATTPLDMLAQALQPIPAHYSASSSVAVSSSNTPTAGARSTALVPSSTPVDDQSQASSSTLAHNASPSPPALSPTTSNVWGWGVFPPHSNSSTSHCSTQTKPTACGLRRLDLNFHSECAGVITKSCCLCSVDPHPCLAVILTTDSPPLPSSEQQVVWML